MNDSVVTAIVEMVKQGGQAAIWVYAIYAVAGVLKFAIGFGTMLAGVYAIKKGAENVAKTCKNKD